MPSLIEPDALRDIYKDPAERAVSKELDHLDVHCRNFIALSPFFVMASAGADGSTDASPRGGPAGFVQVVDDGHLAFGDSPGNNRLDSLTNLTQNPQVGLIFMVPGVNETLRINGRVEIRTDDDLRESLAIDGRAPATAIVVEVQTAFLHCAKALMRSNLWDPDTQVERSVLPTMGQMINDHVGLTDKPESQERMEERYRKVLY